jgi:hypothetical protein
MTGKREELISGYSAYINRYGNNFPPENSWGRTVNKMNDQLPETQEFNCLIIGHERSFSLASQLHIQR